MTTSSIHSAGTVLGAVTSDALCVSSIYLNLKRVVSRHASREDEEGDGVGRF